MENFSKSVIRYLYMPITPFLDTYHIFGVIGYWNSLSQTTQTCWLLISTTSKMESCRFHMGQRCESVIQWRVTAVTTECYRKWRFHRQISSSVNQRTQKMWMLCFLVNGWSEVPFKGRGASKFFNLLSFFFLKQMKISISQYFFSCSPPSNSSLPSCSLILYNLESGIAWFSSDLEYMSPIQIA